MSTNAPLRAEKGTLYEGGIRVPLIVRWPGVAPPGADCHELAATWDLLPTFCAIAGIAPPDQPLDGVDISSVLRDPGASLDRDVLYFHYPHFHHSRPAGAIRRGYLKLVEWFDDGSVELYDLAADIGESNDLATTMPEKVKQMRNDLTAWRQRVGARLPTKNPNYVAEKADDWWNRRTNAPRGVKALGNSLEQGASKANLRAK